MKNRWLDADGKVYIYFSQEQIAEMMGCGLKKVGSLLAELDSRKGIGLITRIRQGLGKPDRIYVRRCICVDLSEGNIQTRQNDISGYIKMADTDMSKVPGNDTDKNKTEINDTEYLSFLSADESEESRRKQIEREAYYKIICHNIGYEYLIEECDREMLDEIVALVVDVISSDREFIWIGRDRKPFDVVKSQFLKLNAEHIRFVMKCLRENTSKVVNIRQYLLTVLYNAPLTISNYYSALVQHDMYGNCPWKPSDLEQQEGRILRQGNQNEKVKIFRYVTENTFDAYMWQILENKQKFISQIMTSKSPVRACEDVDDTALSYAEIKALATGNPYIKEKMDLDVQVSKLKLLKANHTSQIYRLESDIAKNYPVQISALKERIAGMQFDVSVVKNVDLQDNDSFSMNIGNVAYTDKKEAGEAMIAACAGLKAVTTGGKVGEYHGFTLSASYNLFANSFELTIKGKCSYKIEIGKDPLGNIQRIHNALSSIDKKLAESEQKLETVQQQLATAQEEVKKPFPKETELNEKMERLSELNALLNMDEKGNETILADEDIGTEKIPDRDSSRKEEVRDADRNLQETADKVHKPSILERLKQEKARQLAPKQTGTPKPKKNHEQEL